MPCAVAPPGEIEAPPPPPAHASPGPAVRLWPRPPTPVARPLLPAITWSPQPPPARGPPHPPVEDVAPSDGPACPSHRLRRFGPPPKWRRPPPAPLVREGGGGRGGRPAPSAAPRPPDSGGIGRRRGERPVEWAFEEGIRGRAPPARRSCGIETETGIAAAFKLRLVFLPGRRVLVLPEVVRGPREPRPRRLLLVVRRQLTAGAEEGGGGARGARGRRRRRGSGQRRWGRAGGGLGPFGAGQASPRGARRAGMKLTQGRLRQPDPEGEQLPWRGRPWQGTGDAPCRPGRPPPAVRGLPRPSTGPPAESCHESCPAAPCSVVECGIAGRGKPGASKWDWAFGGQTPPTGFELGDLGL